MKKILLGLTAFIAMNAAAEEKAASDLAEMPIDSLKNVELQNVQVVAIRASKKTPMAFTNMNQDQIKAVNFGQDIPYLLSLTPSVTMTSDAGNGIGYTTLRVRGTDPSRINVTANGIPMNDAESAQLFWVNMGDFASSVQSMQIQRGVGTSTNGAGAFGATLNITHISRRCVSAQASSTTIGASRVVCRTSPPMAIWTVPLPSSTPICCRQVTLAITPW